MVENMETKMEARMERVSEMMSYGEPVGDVEFWDCREELYVPCFIHDVSVEKGYLVSWEGANGEEQWVARTRVFTRHDSEEVEGPLAPRVGDKLEVRVNYTGEALGWGVGTVVEIIDGFYHISFGNGIDEVVEFERLRECGDRKNAYFVKEIVGVPEAARQDIVRTGHTLQELAHDLRLSALQLNSTGEVIEMIGPKAAMEDARQALSVHFQRVRRFAQLSGIHQALSQRWQDVNNLRDCAYELSFEVNHDVIGSCIGKAGVNLKKAHRVTGVVSVQVTDFTTEDGSQRHRFNIVAREKKAAETARELLEYVRVKVYVEPEEIGPVIGKKGIHLREIEQKTGVSKFVLVEDPESSDLPYFETVGTRRGVETAKRLFNMHRAYLVKSKQMEDDIRRLRMNLAQLGVSSNISVDIPAKTTQPTAAPLKVSQGTAPKEQMVVREKVSAQTQTEESHSAGSQTEFSFSPESKASQGTATVIPPTSNASIQTSSNTNGSRRNAAGGNLNGSRMKRPNRTRGQQRSQHAHVDQAAAQTAVPAQQQITS